MNPNLEYRFYSFVAGLYISPLQCGLQTAHCVSRMHADLLIDQENDESFGQARTVYDEWAKHDQTIIICQAVNSAGVEEAYGKLRYFADRLGLPATVFYEDRQSLNNAATAAAIVVPNHFYNAVPTVDTKPPGFFKSLFDRKASGLKRFYIYTDFFGKETKYELDSIEGQFIAFLKSYRLA